MKRENVSFVLKIAHVAQASHKLAFLLLAECWDFSAGTENPRYSKMHGSYMHICHVFPVLGLICVTTLQDSEDQRRRTIGKQHSTVNIWNLKVRFQFVFKMLL